MRYVLQTSLLSMDLFCTYLSTRHDLPDRSLSFSASTLGDSLYSSISNIYAFNELQAIISFHPL